MIAYMHLAPVHKSPLRGLMYANREGQYSRDELTAEELVAKGSAHLPRWANGDARTFWKSEDKAYRAREQDREKRGRPPRKEKTCRARRLILALPKELNAQQQEALLTGWLAENLPDHAYSWAIHHHTGALSGEDQPHAHILIAEQQIDPARPEPDARAYWQQRAGYKKDPRMQAGRRELLADLRASWEQAATHALREAGYDLTVRFEPLGERPEPKIGRGGMAATARGVRPMALDEVIRLRQERAKKPLREELQRKHDETVARLREIEQARDREKSWWKGLSERGKELNREGMALAAAYNRWEPKQKEKIAKAGEEASKRLLEALKAANGTVYATPQQRKEAAEVKRQALARERAQAEAKERQARTVKAAWERFAAQQRDHNRGRDR